LVDADYLHWEILASLLQFICSQCTYVDPEDVSRRQRSSSHFHRTTEGSGYRHVWRSVMRTWTWSAWHCFDSGLSTAGLGKKEGKTVVVNPSVHEQAGAGYKRTIMVSVGSRRRPGSSVLRGDVKLAPYAPFFGGRRSPMVHKTTSSASIVHLFARHGR
jgi:hypothetical protein